MSARRNSTRRFTTAASAVILAAGATFTAAPSAGAATTDLPSSVSDISTGVQQSAVGSVVFPVVVGSAVFYLMTSSFSPTGEDICPS